MLFGKETIHGILRRRRKIRGMMMMTIGVTAPRGSMTPAGMTNRAVGGDLRIGVKPNLGVLDGREIGPRTEMITGNGGVLNVDTQRNASSSENRNSGYGRQQSRNRASGTSSSTPTPSNGRTSSLGLQLWNPWLNRGPAVSQTVLVSGRPCLNRKISMAMLLIPLHSRPQ